MGQEGGAMERRWGGGEDGWEDEGSGGGGHEAVTEIDGS